MEHSTQLGKKVFFQENNQPPIYVIVHITNFMTVPLLHEGEGCSSYMGQSISCDNSLIE